MQTELIRSCTDLLEEHDEDIVNPDVYGADIWTVWRLLCKDGLEVCREEQIHEVPEYMEHRDRDPAPFGTERKNLDVDDPAVEKRLECNACKAVVKTAAARLMDAQTRNGGRRPDVGTRHDAIDGICRDVAGNFGIPIDAAVDDLSTVAWVDQRTHPGGNVGRAGAIEHFADKECSRVMEDFEESLVEDYDRPVYDQLWDMCKARCPEDLLYIEREPPADHEDL